MSTEEVPEPWASRMIERGVTRQDGRANITRLAKQADLAVETARRAIKGIGEPSPATVAAIAGVLGWDVQNWMGVKIELGPYSPPEESALLTSPQRDALTTLIRAIAAEQRAGVGNAQQPASIGATDVVIAEEEIVTGGPGPASADHAQLPSEHLPEDPR